MKITIEQAFALEQVYNELREKPLPIRTAYKISKLMKAIETELEFYREQLQKVLEEYGQKDNNGQYILDEKTQSIQLIPEKVSECSRKVQELQNIELDINYNSKFNFDELEALNLNLQNIAAFDSFIEE